MTPKSVLIFLSLMTFAVSLVGCGGAGAGAFGSEGSIPIDSAPVPAPTASAPVPIVGLPLQSSPAPAVAGAVPSPYAGVWKASYDGFDQGSCAPVTIDSAGLIAGACFSSIGNPGSAMQGLVAADGNAMITFGAASATLKFSGPASATGPWSSPSGKGTISFTRVN